MKFNTMIDMDVVTELCNRIKKRRIDLDLSQADLAESAHIGIATLKRVESGQPATLLTTIAIVRALGGIEQLEPLLFSKLSSSLQALPPPPPHALQVRIRTKGDAPKNRPSAEPRIEQEPNYIFSAQNNVTWPTAYPNTEHGDQGDEQ